MLEQEPADHERNEREPSVHEQRQPRPDRGEGRGIRLQGALDVPLALQLGQPAIDGLGTCCAAAVDVRLCLAADLLVDALGGVLGHSP